MLAQIYLRMDRVDLAQKQVRVCCLHLGGLWALCLGFVFFLAHKRPS